jgi:hypothetical protein
MAAAVGFWSVPAVAELLGVDAGKVLGWIRRGEIVGVNIADRQGRRPRWRIAESELQRFIRSRQSSVQPVVRRKKRDGDGVEYFRNGKPVAGVLEKVKTAR